MLLIDIILVLILVSLFARGWKQGFVDSLGELIGAIIAFLVARWLSSPLAIPVGFLMPNHPGLARFISFLIIFLLVAWLVGMVFGLAAKLLKIVTKLPLISLANKILGGIMGFLAGIVFVGSAVYLVFTYRLDDWLFRQLASSVVARYTEQVFSSLLRFLL